MLLLQEGLMPFMQRRDCGFTLIELIMTIVVVAIIAIPLSLTICQQMESTYQSRGFTEALNLARHEMEIVNNLPYNGITDSIDLNYLGYPYSILRGVSFVAGDAGSAESLKQVTVSVTRPGNPAVLARLVTYIARNVTYPFNP